MISFRLVPKLRLGTHVSKLCFAVMVIWFYVIAAAVAVRSRASISGVPKRSLGTRDLGFCETISAGDEIPQIGRALVQGRLTRFERAFENAVFDFNADG